jgi:hypothetical protein
MPCHTFEDCQRKKEWYRGRVINEGPSVVGASGSGVVVRALQKVLRL